MTRLVVSVGATTATEALRAGRVIGRSGAAVRVGPRLLMRAGPSVIAALHPTADVFADARLGGNRAEVRSAALSLAGFGARWISLDGSAEPGTVTDAAAALKPYGAEVLATTVPPEAPDPAGGRGRAVSAAVRRLGSATLLGVLGRSADVGVVAQVRQDVGVFVFAAGEATEVADASERGALAVVVEMTLPAHGGLAEALTGLFEATTGR